MPEGDTIRRLANSIDERFGGRDVTRSELRDPRLVGRDVAGLSLVGADAYGKHLFVRFGDGSTLHAHLMMSGSFVVGPPAREPEWKRRVELWFGNDRLTGVEVPQLGWVATSDEGLITDGLGPDLCAPSGLPDSAAIAGAMRAEPGTAVAAAMLDQCHAAGFGNIYATEVPFLCGIDPHQPVGSIDGLDALVALGVALIRTNAARGPQNTTGRRLGTGDRWVHRTRRGRCRLCGTSLAYRDARRADWGRAVVWCPTCQPAAERAAVDLDRVADLLALHPASKQPYFPH